MDLKPTLKFTNSLDVLYIEHNEILRESNYHLFSKFFAKVDVAKNTNQGLGFYQDYYKNHQKYYDLIIIDMPNIDELNISKEIYKLNKEQDIILLTSNNDIDFFLKVINIGYSDIVIKPFGKKKMVKTFHKVCQNIYNQKFVLEHDYNHYRYKLDTNDYFMRERDYQQ